LAKPFKQSFASMEELNSATPERIGVALVLHMQAEGNRFSPHNFQGSINNWYNNQGSPPWLMQRVSEGMQWAQQMILVVPDLSQAVGSWYVLSRSGAEFDPGVDIERLTLERLLPEFLLHPAIRAASIEIFRIGKYDAAVFEAFKTVENAIREAAEFPADAHGMPMAAKAFNSETGPLAVPGDPPGERQAMQQLMAGAVGVFKNPRSHRNVDLADPIEAAQMLIIASHLLQIVDSRNQAAE
jgi:uncharacterized protein (TIGR02391 family)